jgi:hypothetical protein
MVFKLYILDYIWKYGEGRWAYQMHKTDTNMTDIFMPYCFLAIYIGLPIYNCDNKGAGVMVLNATFNNILVISLRFNLLMEKKHRPVANRC